jgi:hypothetical protein
MAELEEERIDHEDAGRRVVLHTSDDDGDGHELPG